MTKKDTIKLSDLTIRELLDYESACRLICTKYDNATRRYDNSFSPDNTEEAKKYIVYNTIHNNVMEWIEKKVDELG